MSADPVSDLLWAELDAAEVLRKSAWDQHANEALALTLAAGEHAYTDEEWAALVIAELDPLDPEPTDDEDKSMKPWKVAALIVAVLLFELFLLFGTSYVAYRAGGWFAVLCWWALLIGGEAFIAWRAGGRR